MKIGNKGKTDMGTVILVLIALGVVYLFTSGQLSLPTGPVSQVSPPTQQIVGTCGFGTSTIRMSVDDAATGLVAYGNAFLYDSGHNPVVAETLVNDRAEQLTTAGPVSFNGYVVFVNDNFATGTTDRGAEIYATKRAVSFGPCVGTYEIPKFLSYNESTPTWTGKDNGVVEATTNVTVGTSIVDTTSLQVSTAANTCLGNPDFARPLAVVFNTSAAASSSVWDEIRPLNHDGTISTPSLMTGWGIVGQPYILPFGALCDLPAQPGKFDTIKEFLIRLDPGASDVGSSSAATYSGAEDVYAMLLDKTWCPPVDDRPYWHECWSLERTAAADTDIGLQSNNNAKLIAIG